MSGPDDMPRSREHDDIEFFATLPSSVQTPEDVRAWLAQLARQLSDASTVRIQEEANPTADPLGTAESGAWFRIADEAFHPICPGRAFGDPGEGGDLGPGGGGGGGDDGGDDGGGGGGGLADPS
jgi:hypothetical protein